MQTDEILAALVRLEAGQAKLEAGQAKLEAGQAKLEASQGKLEASQGKLEVGQTSLRVDLMARMDRLEDRMTAVIEDIDVNMGAAAMARRVNDNTREELRTLSSTVDSLYRKLIRLETAVHDRRDENRRG